MSKGGAGKVYFVLYLAVILELLIIIVERDEAEEHLIQKQKESMKIVESILSQLQSGSGSEGINTRPQDEITLQDQMKNVIDKDATKIKQDRTYQVLVGVTDVSATDKTEGLEPKEAAEKVKNLIRLANVQDLDYQIFYHNNANAAEAPAFMTDDSIRKAKIDFTKLGAEQEIGEVADGGRWRMLALKRIELDMEQTQQYKEPMYKYTAKVGDVDGFAPPTARGKDSSFMYSQIRTDDEAKKVGGKYKKRVFLVRFQPPNRPGWYKLRFASKTNRILGIQGDINAKEISDEEKVNIGTVQLKVKDLRKVKKTLTEQLEGLDIPSADDLAGMKVTVDEFQSKAEAAIQKVKNESAANDPKALERIRRIELYTYIAKLLAPGASSAFDQNRAAIEFDIHVVAPPKPEDPDPFVNIDNPNTYTFDKLARTEIPFQAAPFQAGKMPTVTCDPPLPVQIVDAGVTSTASAAGGATAQLRGYKAVVSQAVPPGEYKLTIRHTNKSGKPDEKIAVLKVFESKLENLEDVTSAITNLNYGSELTFAITPADQKKMPPNQFLLQVNIGGDQTAQPIRGITYPPRQIPATASNVSLDVFWEDPTTKEKVSLLPSQVTGTITQGPPSIISNQAKFNPITNIKDPEIVVQGIQIKAPVIDTGGVRAKISDVKAEIVKCEPEGAMSKYKFTGTLVSVGGSYEARIKVDGMPLNTKRGDINGTVKVIIQASAKNSVNGAQSDKTSRTIRVPVTY